jgi:hypothetical protein
MPTNGNMRGTIISLSLMRLSAICDEGPAQSRSQSDAIIVVGVCVGTGRLVWHWRKGRDDEIGELRDLRE